jgi:hypothetical protein
VFAELDAFAIARVAARDVGLATVGSRAHAVASNRIAALAAAAPAHRRVAVSRLAVSARRAVASSRSAGAERLLSALLADRTSSPAEDAAETWLARVIDLAAPAPNAERAEAAESGHTVRAVLLLIR